MLMSWLLMLTASHSTFDIPATSEQFAEAKTCCSMWPN